MRILQTHTRTHIHTYIYTIILTLKYYNNLPISRIKDITALACFLRTYEIYITANDSMIYKSNWPRLYKSKNDKLRKWRADSWREEIQSERSRTDRVWCLRVKKEKTRCTCESLAEDPSRRLILASAFIGDKQPSDDEFHTSTVSRKHTLVRSPNSKTGEVTQ